MNPLSVLFAATVCLALPIAALSSEVSMPITLQTDYLTWAIGSDGSSIAFTDRRSGVNYLAPGPPQPLAVLTAGGEQRPCTGIRRSGGLLRASFGEGGPTVTFRAIVHPRHIVLRVVSVRGEAVERLSFPNLTLTLTGSPAEPFAACAMALNLRTNVGPIPMATGRLQATCYGKIGMEGAQVAILGAPTPQLRAVMQQVVEAAPELPRSQLGGPWAWDAPANRGSYLFNFDGVSEQTAEPWIAACKRLGFTQLDFHGGSSFRFGDFRPNPTMYPGGYADIRRAIDTLHEAGILAGLHTYAFFIDKSSPYVTPVPDPRLAKAAVFTLSEGISADAQVVPVLETTAEMSTTTGFFVRNSVTLQIEDELIVFGGLTPQPPFGFTGCQRGAYGTMPSAHPAGAKVHHLKEVFGLFVPDPETSLLTEIAENTARIYNECGFDMIYLDALDGEDVLAGHEWGWHYGSKFTWEIVRRLKRPALMEMSTFHHHLWYVRSRMGAWDHPQRAHKDFIDLHVAGNESCDRMFLPSQLGWWALVHADGIQVDPILSDTLEYLCCKAIGSGAGLSLMGLSPATLAANPGQGRFADLIGRYERLRAAGTVSEQMKAALRQPGREFTLVEAPDGSPALVPAAYPRHTVSSKPSSTQWTVENPFGEQPLRLRIEALLEAETYDSPQAMTLLDPAAPEQLGGPTCADGVTLTVTPSELQTPAGGAALTLSANNANATRQGSWASIERAFEPATDLGARQALGVWVHGDGSGAVLCIALRSPWHIAGGIAERFVTLDYDGWRYIELVEVESDRHDDYVWPFDGGYAVYRELVNFRALASVAVWLNDVPAGGSVTCHIGEIRALPLTRRPLIGPTVTTAAGQVSFAGEVPAVGYLEWDGSGPATVYGPDSAILGQLEASGAPGPLAAGANRLSLTCGADSGRRARVTVMMRGQG